MDFLALDGDVDGPTENPTEGMPERIRVEAQNKLRRIEQHQLDHYLDWMEHLDSFEQMHNHSIKWAGLLPEVVSEASWLHEACTECRRAGWSRGQTDGYIARHVRRTHNYPQERQSKPIWESDFRKMDSRLAKVPTVSSVGYRLDFPGGRLLKFRYLKPHLAGDKRDVEVFPFIDHEGLNRVSIPCIPEDHNGLFG